ncbi:MAG: InlB B-repeat-containing protein [Bacteroidales bacterium]|nr:InlB B-repeat-containing protein [Bacteroidales bacterium]
MKKWYFVCLILHWVALPLSCSFDRDNPFDEGGFKYVPPEIILNEEASSIKNQDTIHFDSVTITLEGNKEESLFKFKIDNEVWAIDWQPAGTYGFGKLTDGVHKLYINSMYDGGELITSDSISFYILTKGYKPQFEKRNDTTITLFSGNPLTLHVKAEGYSPLTYSWIKGNVLLEGKKSDSLKFTSFTSNDTASYKCIVSNEYGIDTSRAFLLKYRAFSGGVKGVVTDTSGTKLKNATVILSPSNNKDTTDSAGLFVFSSLSGNSYSLKISLSKYYDTTLTEIAVTDTEMVILPNIKLKMIDTTIYKVTYNSNGNDSGTVPLDTIKYKPGSKIAVAGSNTLSKVGYSFSKWNTKKDGTGDNVASGDSFTVNGNVTFYAQWVVKQFTLSFNGNSNTSGDAPELKKYSYHATVTVPDKGTLKRDGYTFTGWNTAQNGSGNSFSAADTFTMPASEMVLYAKWTALPTYTVTYNKNSADSGTVPVDSNPYYKGKEVTVAGNPGKLSKSSASFSGWNTKGDGTGESYNAGAKFPMPDSAVMLYVKWTTNPTYSIIYHSTTSTGGNVPNTVTSDSGTIVTISDSGSLYKTGYSFVGWNTKEDGSGKAYKTGDKFTMGAVGIDLYAQWTKAQFTITYHGNGNTSGTIPQKTTHLYQTEITISGLGDLAKTGYSFVGWNIDSAGNGLDYQPGDKITIDKNVNLYARWSKNKYKVVYIGNGNDGGSAPASMDYLYTATVTVLDNSTLTKIGYSFNGWSRLKNGGSGIIASGSTYQMGAMNDTLYAQWKVNQYKVVFNTMGGDPLSFILVNYGDTVPTPSNPIKKSYVFSNWCYDSECIRQWNFSTEKIYGDDTLYAKWVIMDVDGNLYTEVKIGNQVWMVENLKTTRFRDSSWLTLVEDNATWDGFTSPAYCWYDNDSASYKSSYGTIYNWHVIDPKSNKKIAPNGWHIPTDAEWATLISYTGGTSIAGGELKETGTVYWKSPNEGSTNRYGFSARAGGTRGGGVFYEKREYSYWWTSTEYDSTNAWMRVIGFGDASIGHNFVSKFDGLYIRCIRDQ